MVKRRNFIKQIAAGSLAALSVPRLLAAPLTTGKSDKLGDLLPTRPMGKTGVELSIYCLGGYHVGRAKNEKVSQAMIERGMELGCRYYETAWIYHDGYSEELFGKYLTPKYRDQIFLATKTNAKTAAGSKKQIEDSLRRMNCDQIDLLYMHAVRDPSDVDGRIAAGVLEVMLEAQQKGQVKYLGFTGHRMTSAQRRLMERVAGKDPFVAVQIPVNPLDVAKPDSFTTALIPELHQRAYGVMGMKPLAGGGFFTGNEYGWETDDPIIPNYLTLEDVIWFNLSQPITSMVCGTESVEHLDRNIEAVNRFAKLSMDDQEKIVKKLLKFVKTERLEYYRPKLAP
ncbi:MAG: aldo/keto reductase [Saprospiraceae bacterium]|nr:aldo/keto reductase [Saprospiraceae bacterium]